MIRIFQLITSIHLGGAEIVAFNLSEYCKKNFPEKFEFTIVELFQSNDPYSINKKKEILLNGIQIISLSKGSKRFSLLLGPLMLLYYFLKRKPQIVHSHTDLPDFVLSVALKICSIFHLKTPKIIRTIHNTELWATHRKIGKCTETSYNNDCIIAVSEASLEAYKNLRTKYNLSKSYDQNIIFNGCLVPKKSEHEFRTSKEKINIAFCGRFEHQKGIDILIKRIESINSKFENSFLFHIIGNGKYQPDVNKLASNHSNVLVYNAVSSIADKMYAFDFIIMPSRYEGLVLTSIEASLSKVPVIAAYAKGLDETLPSDWVLKFHLDNEEEIFILLDNIRNNRYDIEKFKNSAFKFVSEKFSLPRMINEYSKIYLKLNE